MPQIAGKSTIMTLVAAAAVVAGGAYAFSAAASAPAGTVGTVTTSGVSVSGIRYAIDTGSTGSPVPAGEYRDNAANIASVSFVLDHPVSPPTVSAAFVDAHRGQVATYSTCSPTPGFADEQHVTCSADGAEVNLAQAVSLVVNARR